MQSLGKKKELCRLGLCGLGVQVSLCLSHIGWLQQAVLHCKDYQDICAIAEGI
jgi:hypothetical protein